MSYQKMLVDNVSCSRRFHVTFDDEAPKQAHTEIKCPFCNVVIFAADNHPQVKLARQENLVQTAELSEQITSACEYRDVFSDKVQS